MSGAVYYPQTTDCFGVRFGKVIPECEACVTKESCKTKFYETSVTELAKNDPRPEGFPRCYGKYTTGNGYCGRCEKADGRHALCQEVARSKAQGESRMSKMSRLAPSAFPPVKVEIAKDKRDKTLTYCEAAPPRDVVESSGLVWSYGLRHEYERHKVWAEPFIHTTGTKRFLLPQDWMNDVVEEMFLPEPDLFGGKVFMEKMSPERFKRVMPSQEIPIVAKRCKLCGAWMRTKIITAANDLRRAKREHLFTSTKFGFTRTAEEVYGKEEVEKWKQMKEWKHG